MSLTIGEKADPPSRRSRPKPAFARRPAWERRYAWTVVVLDALAVVVALLLAQVLRFGFDTVSLSVRGVAIPYPLVAMTMVPVWLGVMAAGGCYEPKALGMGSDEFRRVLNAAVRFLAVVAVAFYAARIDVARGFVAVALPLATLFTVGLRYCARRWLHRRRGQGRDMHRVLLVGPLEESAGLARHLERSPYHGFAVVGACVSGASSLLTGVRSEVPVLGGPDEVQAALLASQADMLVVTGSGVLPSGALRRLAWQLEGSGVDLMVAPDVTDVAGPRIDIRPVDGLPLLHVEEPQLGGPARLAKASFDRTAAGLALITLSPVLLILGLAVRVTSPGPVLFRQERVGRRGQQITIRKFRTMVSTSEQELVSLAEHNEHDGLLFKIRQDPRCTPLGRRLRRWSLDELPQLWNVIRGDMSLVGPRPPLPSEVERYGHDVRRRLLVKPGLTGLWQVNGRADLPWDEAVRLDLYYVDNWSPALDMFILWKTLKAVLQGKGAY